MSINRSRTDPPTFTLPGAASCKRFELYAELHNACQFFSPTRVKAQFFGANSKKTPGRKRPPGVLAQYHWLIEAPSTKNYCPSLFATAQLERRRGVCLKQSMIEPTLWMVKQKSFYACLVGGQDVRWIIQSITWQWAYESL